MLIMTKKATEMQTTAKKLMTMKGTMMETNVDDNDDDDGNDNDNNN